MLTCVLLCDLIVQCDMLFHLMRTSKFSLVGVILEKGVGKGSVRAGAHACMRHEQRVRGAVPLRAHARLGFTTAVFQVFVATVFNMFKKQM